MCSQTRLSVVLLLGMGGVAFAAEVKQDRFGDPLPEGAVARLGSLRWRNEGPPFCAAFAADGKTLIVHENASLSTWDVATGKTVRRVAINNAAGLRRRRISGDGKTLILSGFDNTLRFVDTATGEERQTLNHASHGQIHAFDVSRDGKILVAVHRASIVLWDVAGGKLLHEFKGPQFVELSPRWPVALTADGKQLVLPHADSSLHLVDTATGKELRAFDIPSPQPKIPLSRLAHRLIFSPDGRYLAYETSIFPFSLYETATGKRLRELPRLQGIVSGLAFTPNSRFLAVTDYGGIHLFGVLSGKEIRKLPRSYVTGNELIFSPDGRTLAALEGCRIDLWNLADNRRVHPLVGHLAAIPSMVFFPDGKRLVSTDIYGEMIVWEIASASELSRRSNTPVLSLAVDEDGDSLRFLSYATAFVWNPKKNLEESRPVFPGPSVSMTASSPDGRSVVGMTFQPTRQVHLFDRNTGKTTPLPELPERAFVAQVVFSPDSRRLAASCTDGILRLWDRDTAALVRKIKMDMPGRSLYLTFSGDGRSLALFDGQLRIREIAGGERLRIPAVGNPVSLAYSADARFLACGQWDGKITVYSAVSGKSLAQWQGKQGFVRSLAYSRDGRLLASGGENGTILIWKAPEDESVPAAPKAKELLSLWQTLSGTDAAAAYRAMSALTAAPAQTMPLLKERLRLPGKTSDLKQLARWIAELDDDAFTIRERATRRLSEAGADAAEALHRALTNDPSPEVRRRVEMLLKRLNEDGDPERLRSLRALEILERIGSPAAQELLRELKGKPMSAEFHGEIDASLRRLEQRR